MAKPHARVQPNWVAGSSGSRAEGVVLSQNLTAFDGAVPPGEQLICPLVAHVPEHVTVDEQKACTDEVDVHHLIRREVAESL
ncbi:hypothetical protein ACFWP3_26415 [Streptomyces sp. NPDC058525]|uniref:hypothetical protein n=1 Tax=Streptomyces sp. NPDC058525 TaxID=3346538 RepID=UPI0036621B95